MHVHIVCLLRLIQTALYFKVVNIPQFFPGSGHRCSWVWKTICPLWGLQCHLRNEFSVECNMIFSSLCVHLALTELEETEIVTLSGSAGIVSAFHDSKESFTLWRQHGSCGCFSIMRAERRKKMAHLNRHGCCSQTRVVFSTDLIYLPLLQPSGSR